MWSANASRFVIWYFLAGVCICEEADDINYQGVCKSDIELNCLEKEHTLQQDDFFRRKLLANFINIAQKHAVYVIAEQFNLNKMNDRDFDKDIEAPNAKCLLKIMHQQIFSGTKNQTQNQLQIKQECSEEVRKFFIKKYPNIQYDFGLLVGCSIDILARCQDVEGNQIFTCLKIHKTELQNECKEIVVKRQIEAAEDIRFDLDIMEQCGQDYAAYCESKGYVGGNAIQCLNELLIQHFREESRIIQLTGKCMHALYVRNILDSEDIRFKYQLDQDCQTEQNRYCSNVLQRGEAKVLSCLEQQSSYGSFGDKCQKQLKMQSVLRANDFRFDYRLRTQCEQDVVNICPQFVPLFKNQFKQQEEYSNDAQKVLECLRNSYQMIKNEVCLQGVQQHMIDAYQDATLDTKLMKHCKLALKQNNCYHSNDKLTCIHKQLQTGVQVVRSCFDIVTERQVQRMQNINFNHELVYACKHERQKFCATVTPGESKVIKCLQEHMSGWGFGQGCQTKLNQLVSVSNQDIRLMLGLKLACDDDIKLLCSAKTPGEGQIIHCLIDNRQNLNTPACRLQLLKVVGVMQDKDRFDYELFRGCSDDVKQFCPSTRPGNGQIYDCLKNYKDKLTSQCTKLQAAFQSVQIQEMFFNQTVQESCKDAISIYCSQHSEVNSIANCLIKKSRDENYPKQCALAIRKMLLTPAISEDLDKDTKDACMQDVTSFCQQTIQWNKISNSSSEDTTQCLVRKVNSLQRGCQQGIVQAVQQQMLYYKIGVVVTKDCDTDVLKLCQLQERNIALLAPGQIQKCLLSHAQELSPQCYSILSLTDEEDIQFGGLIEKYWEAKVPRSTTRKIARDLEKDLNSDQQKFIEQKLRLQLNAIPWTLAFAFLVSYVMIIGLVGYIICGPIQRYYYQKDRQNGVQSWSLFNKKKYLKKILGSS